MSRRKTSKQFHVLTSSFVENWAMCWSVLNTRWHNTTCLLTESEPSKTDFSRVQKTQWNNYGNNVVLDYVSYKNYISNKLKFIFYLLLYEAQTNLGNER